MARFNVVLSDSILKPDDIASVRAFADRTDWIGMPSSARTHAGAIKVVLWPEGTDTSLAEASLLFLASYRMLQYIGSPNGQQRPDTSNWLAWTRRIEDLTATSRREDADSSRLCKDKMELSIELMKAATKLSPLDREASTILYASASEIGESADIQLIDKDDERIKSALAIARLAKQYAFDDGGDRRVQAETETDDSDDDAPVDPETACAYADLAYHGDGVKQDYVEAAMWYRISATQGYAVAQYNLALMHENGEGMPQDHAEAAKWYKLAADQGHAGSKNNLATLYECGDGVRQDYVKALDLYRQAADAGDQNGASNSLRLEALLNGPEGNRLRYTSIVASFIEFLANRTPPIGDCKELPHPKSEILYALRWLMYEYDHRSESTRSREDAERYDTSASTLGDLFSHLARDWVEIAPEDRQAISRLRDCKSFPDWATSYKIKYIDETRARNEAFDVFIKVSKDRLASRAT